MMHQEVLARDEESSGKKSLPKFADLTMILRNLWLTTRIQWLV